MTETQSDKVLIIAEAGVNHDGDLNQALKLVDIAAEAGADIVKFQSFDARSLATGGRAGAVSKRRGERKNMMVLAISWHCWSASS